MPKVSGRPSTTRRMVTVGFLWAPICIRMIGLLVAT